MRIQRDKKRKNTKKKPNNNSKAKQQWELAMGEAPCRAIRAITARNWAQNLPVKKEERKREKRVLANSENENKTMTKATNNKLKQLTQNVR